MNWPQVRQRHERWFQGWLVLAPIVGFGSTTLVKNQLYRVWKVTHGLTDGISAAEAREQGLVPPDWSGAAWYGGATLWCSPCSTSWRPELGPPTPPKIRHPMIDFHRHLWLKTGLFVALGTLASCEGATYVNQHFTNRTDETISLGFRSNEAATG